MNPYLFTTNKKIDLQQYLPEYIRSTAGIQLEPFLQLFEDYLNNMYEGNKSIEYDYTEVADIDQFLEGESFFIQNVAELVDVAGDPIEVWQNDSSPISAVIQNVSALEPEPIPPLDTPLGRTFIWESKEVGDGRIGILEKIHRIINLIDGTMVPDRLIYQTANQLGYDRKTQLLNFNNFGDNPWDFYYDGDTYLNSDNPDDLVNERLKFMVDNLPQWYTQKVTRRGLKILLFAANIIGNVATEYTRNYSTVQSDWSNIDLSISDTIGEGGRNVIFEDFDRFLAGTQPGDNRLEWYPSPHFNIWIDLNATNQGVDYDVLFGDGENSLSNIMYNTRPVNTVYEGLISVYTTRNNFYYRNIQWQAPVERTLGTVGPFVGPFVTNITFNDLLIEDVDDPSVSDPWVAYTLDDGTSDYKVRIYLDNVDETLLDWRNITAGEIAEGLGVDTGDSIAFINPIINREEQFVYYTYGGVDSNVYLTADIDSYTTNIVVGAGSYIEYDTTLTYNSGTIPDTAVFVDGTSNYECIRKIDS